MLNEFIRFFSLTVFIVIISKYFLANYIRKLAYTADLNSTTIGQISGIATSVPELLSVIFASSIGMIDTSFFNIFSSNVINVFLFIFSTLMAKNFVFLKNKIFIFDYIIIAFTTTLPLILIFTKIYTYSIIVPAFFILFLLFLRIKQVVYNNALATEETTFEKRVKLSLNKKRKRILWYSFVLLISCILLFFLGNSLSKSLETLFLKFNIPEILLGFLLGVFTSIPELITFLSAQKHYKLTNEKRLHGVVESLNNLTMSNIMNLFFIQAIGILIYIISNS